MMREYVCSFYSSPVTKAAVVEDQPPSFSDEVFFCQSAEWNTVSEEGIEEIIFMFKFFKMHAKIFAAE